MFLKSKKSVATLMSTIMLCSVPYNKVSANEISVRAPDWQTVILKNEEDIKKHCDSMFNLYFEKNKTYIPVDINTDRGLVTNAYTKYFPVGDPDAINYSDNELHKDLGRAHKRAIMGMYSRIQHAYRAGSYYGIEGFVWGMNKVVEHCERTLKYHLDNSDKQHLLYTLALDKEQCHYENSYIANKDCTQKKITGIYDPSYLFGIKSVYVNYLDHHYNSTRFITKDTCMKEIFIAQNDIVPDKDNGKEIKMSCYAFKQNVSQSLKNLFALGYHFDENKKYICVFDDQSTKGQPEIETLKTLKKEFKLVKKINYYKYNIKYSFNTTGEFDDLNLIKQPRYILSNKKLNEKEKVSGFVFPTDIRMNNEAYDILLDNLDCFSSKQETDEDRDNLYYIF